MSTRNRPNNVATRLLAGLIAMAIVGACSMESPDPQEGGSGPIVGSPFVGDWLDADGQVVPDEDVEGEGFVLESWVVSGHCDWDSATFMLLSWPPGRVDANWDTSDIDDGSVRMFVRDPEGLFSASLLGGLETDVVLPDTAVDSGLHREGWAIWTAPDDETAIYLVGPDHAERWPRARTYIGCA